MENSVPGLSVELKESPCTCTHCNTPEKLLRPARGGKSWAALLFIIHIIGFMFLWRVVPKEFAPGSKAMERNKAIMSSEATESVNATESDEDTEITKTLWSRKATEISNAIESNQAIWGREARERNKAIEINKATEINKAIESKKLMRSKKDTEINESMETMESNKARKRTTGVETDASKIIIDTLREDRDKSNVPFDDFVPLNIAAIKVFFYGFLWSMAFSLILTDLFMLAMYSVPAVMIKAGIISEIALLAVLAIIAIYFGYTWTGRFLCLATIIFGLNYSIERRQVPFSATVLKITMTVLKKHPGMIGVNCGCFFVGSCYESAVFRMLDYLLTLYKRQHPHVIYFAIYSVFTAYWSFRVTYKIAHFIVASVYTTDLSSSISNQKVLNPTKKSLKRALTSSFGTICYESLIPKFKIFIPTDLYSPLDNRRVKSCTLMVSFTICATVGSSVYLLVTQYFNLPTELSVKYALILGSLSYVVPFTALDIIETGNEVIIKCFSEDPMAFVHSKDALYNQIAHTYHQVSA